MLSGIQAQYVLHQLFLARINTRHGHAPGVEGDVVGDEFAEVEHKLILKSIGHYISLILIFQLKILSLILVNDLLISGITV